MTRLSLSAGLRKLGRMAARFLSFRASVRVCISLWIRCLADPLGKEVFTGFVALVHFGTATSWLNIKVEVWSRFGVTIGPGVGEIHFCGRLVTVKHWVTMALTLSTPAVPNCCCSKGLASYWSNPLFLISDIRALCGAQSWAPERPNVRN